MYICAECVHDTVCVKRFDNSNDFVQWVKRYTFTNPVVFITPMGCYYESTDIINRYEMGIEI
jgi:hypothetical protein